MELRNLEEIIGLDLIIGLVMGSEGEWIRVISKFQVCTSLRILAPVREKMMIVLLFCLFGVE